MLRRLLIPLLLMTLTACGSRRTTTVVVQEQPPAPRPVSIEVEVYDPESGFVWQDVGVRVVRSYNEWSDCICDAPIQDLWIYTDANGLVLLTEFDIADADVGFIEDSDQRALIEPALDADEAVVTIEVWSPDFAPVIVDVPLDWEQPDVFVSVPFLAP